MSAFYSFDICSAENCNFKNPGKRQIHVHVFRSSVHHYSICNLRKYTLSEHILLTVFHSLGLFSSPEPKAQVSYSEQNLYVVRRRCRRCRRCHKLFTFSSSSPEPLGQFQPNLAQSILVWRGFKFVQTKCSALFQGEIITK